MAYFCKKCGQPFSDLYVLTHSGSCTKGGCHEPYAGHETGPFHCKKCGQPFSDLYVLTHSGSCGKGGEHEPLD